MYNYKYPAIVLGMSETGLGICRSLGKLGIDVYGISHTKEVGLYSKYTNGIIFSNPETEKEKFYNELNKLLHKFKKKPVLFIASDNYLPLYMENEVFFNNHFQHTLPSADLMSKIQNKFAQYKLVKDVTNVPKTAVIKKYSDIENILHEFNFPVIIKAQDVNVWRTEVGKTKKCLNANNIEELKQILKPIFNKNITTIVQEKILSEDQKNHLLSTFISKSGEMKLFFTLQKIHQFPINFGVGTSAKSYRKKELEDLGKKLFKSINYRGVGSAEFKYDQRDDKYKLVEINTRYWQQNSLADRCGMNFPKYDYLDATGQEIAAIDYYEENIKWISLFIELQHIYTAIKAQEFSLFKWYQRIRNFHITSIFSSKDINPFLAHILIIIEKIINIIPKSINQKIVKEEA